jgi:YHS domain-containing protein
MRRSYASAILRSMHDTHGSSELPMAGHIDPVCGMTVDPAARPELQLEHLGQTFYFCSKGCMLDFRDDPDKFLDPGFQPMEM